MFRPALGTEIAIVGMAVAVGVWGLVVSSVSQGESNSCGAPVEPPTATPIHHLFFLIKENHAFENYFGSLPGVLGNPPNASLPTTWGGSTYAHPFALTRNSTGDLPHDAASALADFDGGRNDGFVAQAALASAPTPDDAAGYYTRTQIAPYFDYARNYALADRFFAGVAGPTVPNRMFDLAATNVTESGDALPPSGGFDVPTILDQMESARISWAYDYTNYTPNLAPQYFGPLLSEPCTPLSFVPLSYLGAQLARPVAPAVVFIDPSGDPLHSEHPPENVSVGAQWSVSVVNSILSSPVGPSSAIFLFFDEFGGFWDPIPPPVRGALPEGFRVPLMVISDYTPAGLRIDQPLDPSSLLRFVDDNFQLPYLNSRVASASPLTGAFDFSHPPRSPVILSTNVSFTTRGLGTEPQSTGLSGGHDGITPHAAISSVRPGASSVAVPSDIGQTTPPRRAPRDGARHVAPKLDESRRASAARPRPGARLPRVGANVRVLVWTLERSGPTTGGRIRPVNSPTLERSLGAACAEFGEDHLGVDN